MRPLSAKRGVVAMPRMYHSVIVKATEDLAFKIIHQRPEVHGRSGLARATGEQAVAGEQVHTTGTGVTERDRTWRMAD